MKRISVLDENISPNQRRLRLQELSGIPISERNKRKISDVVSMVEPSKYHNRMNPRIKFFFEISKEEFLKDLKLFKLIFDNDISS